MAYRVYPLHTGYLFAGDVSSCDQDPASQWSPHVPALSFLVSNGRDRLLIDTGMPSTQEALEHRIASVQPEGFDVVSRLSRLRLLPEQISAVVFTHLHWDHLAYVARFAGVPKLVQQKEANFAMHPPSAYRFSYRRAEKVIRDPATHLVEEEFQFDPYIFLFATPGHTPGHQSVGVRTASGLVIIAGDAAWPGEKGLSPPRKAVDVKAAKMSFQRLARLGAPILAGHDPRAMTHAVYK